MGSIIIDDIEVLVGPYKERTATLRIGGLPGAGTESHCQIVLSSLRIFYLHLDLPIIMGYRDPVTGEVVRFDFDSTAGDPERVIADASIASARLSPSPGIIQYADFGPDVSSASLSNASSVTFKLHVKTSTDEAVYARASVAIHTT